jgi:16S rRNA C967 or C1407 C5-methylase (RsmB/RsmF family)
MVVYITRSIHPVENEYIVEEVKDILGSGWKLVPVLPEMTDDPHYDYEIGVFILLTN